MKKRLLLVSLLILSSALVAVAEGCTRCKWYWECKQWTVCDLVGEGDYNGDGAIDIFDYAILYKQYGTVNATLNLTGDNNITITDVLLLINNFGKSVNCTTYKRCILIIRCGRGRGHR